MPMLSSQGSPLHFDSRLASWVKEFKIELSKADVNSGAPLFADRSKDFHGGKAQWNLMEGMGQANYVPEGSDPQTDAPADGYKKQAEAHQYGLAVLITKRARKQGGEKFVSDLTRFLRKSYMDTIEAWRAAFHAQNIQGATVSTVNGRNAVDVNAVTGVSYFNGSHGYTSSGVTNSNLSASARTMSVTALTGMAQQGRGWQSYNGLPRAGVPTGRVVVGDNLVEQTNVILNSMLTPDSANNGNNAVRYTGFKTAYHWGCMGASEFMVEFSTDGEHPGYIEAWEEKYDRLSYRSNSGQRHIEGYLFCGTITGVNPYQFITSRISQA